MNAPLPHPDAIAPARLYYRYNATVKLLGEDVFPVLANDYGSSVLATHGRYVVEVGREQKRKLPKEAKPSNLSRLSLEE